MIAFSGQVGDVLRMPWRNAIAVGRAYDLLRTDLIDHLACLQRSIGYRYCRFHAIFDDDMQVVVRDADGALRLQWRQVDHVYDRLLALGLKPFVELNPMPAALASGGQTVFWYRMNVTPPRSWAEWGWLVGSFVGHLVERYGIDEVRTWYFEVWNEPNLDGFWPASRQDYFRLYDVSAAAVKAVDPALRIGGPASSKACWLEDLIDHCAVEGIPLDFISSHLYPQDEYVEHPDRDGSPYRPGAFFEEVIAGARKRIDARVAGHGMPPVEIHWTEWNAMACASTAGVEWIDNTTNDSLHGAAFVARACAALDRTVDTLCWWVASDVFFESGLSQAAFSMTYGQLTVHGIPKASCQAFALMRRMAGRRLEAVPSAGAPAGAGVLATRDGEVLNLLLWNQRLLEDPSPARWSGELLVPAPAGDRVVIGARIAAGAGSAYEAWLGLGAPHNLSPVEESALRAMAEPRWDAVPVRSDGSGIRIPLDLGPGEVHFVQVRPPGVRAGPRSADPKAMAAWNAVMGARSR